MKKKVIRHIVICLILALTFSIVVSSDSFTKNITVQFNDAKLDINGVAIQSDLIRYNNQVFAPVDVLSGYLNKTYSWDSKTHTATVTDNTTGVISKTFANGDVYTGEILNGKYHGAGTFRFADGTKCIGEYKIGVLDGAATIYFKDGAKFTGEFKDNLPNGYCKLYNTAGGLSFEGGYLKGDEFGEGTRYYDNGKPVEKGFFENGKLIVGTLYYSSGGIAFEGTLKNGLPSQGKAYNNGLLIFQGSFDEQGNPIYSTNELKSSASKPIDITEDYIESKIKGNFEGYKNGRLFELTNGQVWKQTSYTYSYSFKYMPEVTIYKDGMVYKMIVEGEDKTITVERIK